MNEISPSCHGFLPAEKDSKLEDQIAALEDEMDLEDDGEEPFSPAVTGTPKRKKSDECKNPRKVKYRGERLNMSGEHPEIGTRIVMDTVFGKQIYAIYSKKNKKTEDFTYILINSDGKETSFDMKSQDWEYCEEEDVISPHNE